MKKNLSRVSFALLLLGAAVAVVLAMRPAPIPVDTATAQVGPLRVDVSGLGKTKFERRLRITAPAMGHCSRIELKVGDRIEAGQVIALIGPGSSPILDPRSRRELVAQLSAATVQQAQSRAAVSSAELAQQYAQSELERAKALVKSQAIPKQRYEEAQFTARARAQQVEAARLAVAAATAQVQVARMRLTRFDERQKPEERSTPKGELLPVRAAFGGVVLQILERGPGPVAVGTPLIELGDPTSLMAEVELLTTDAMQVKPQAVVSLQGGRDSATFSGRVRLVEPAAYTKVSALGVEEQRVKVIVDPEVGGNGWGPLGDGFSLDAKIAVQQQTQVLKVPNGALFSNSEGWQVFVVSGERVQLRRISVGIQNEREAQVLSGLREGEQVVLYPSAKLTAGASIQATTTDPTAKLDAAIASSL